MMSALSLMYAMSCTSCLEGGVVPSASGGLIRGAGGFPSGRVVGTLSEL